MIRSTLKKILNGLVGRKPTAPAAPARAPAPVARPARPPEPQPDEDHGHDHGHSHGHSHGHGHDEDAAPEPVKPAAVAPAPKPAAAAPAPKAAAAPATRPAAVVAPEAADAAPAAAAAAAKKKPAVEVTSEETPNPNARKFTTSVRVVEKGSLSFNSADEAEKHPLGKALWALGGVRGVFAVNDFVTVTKEESADWNKLTPRVVKAIKKAL